MPEISLNQRSRLLNLVRQRAKESVTNSNEFWDATANLDDEKKYWQIVWLFNNYKIEFALRLLEDLFVGEPSEILCQYCDKPMIEFKRHWNEDLFAHFARCQQLGCKNVKWLVYKTISKY